MAHKAWYDQLAGPCCERSSRAAPFLLIYFDSLILFSNRRAATIGNALPRI
jgi:hypothetical protein